MTALAAGALIATAIGVAAPANAAQGGVDHSGGRDGAHSWIKIGYQEFKANGNGVRGCPNVPADQCNHLAIGVSREYLAHPDRQVGGYWAEYYYNTTRLQSGTW